MFWGLVPFFSAVTIGDVMDGKLWCITIEYGKVYCQVAERSFHLSMAALGYEDVSSDPVSVMVEVDKAQFVLCTLQAGKIPQQSLDHNFTEGEEVRFFLEGGKGQVHLTGYLFETPQEIGFDEFQPLTDTDESGSSAAADDDSDKESSVSSNAAAPGELASLNELDSEDEDDEDWTPDKMKKSKGKKKASEEVVLDLMEIDEDYDSESDEDWCPDKETKNKSSKGNKTELDEDDEDDSDSEEGDEDFDREDYKLSLSDGSQELTNSEFSGNSIKNGNTGFSWKNFLSEELDDEDSSEQDIDWKPEETKDDSKKKLRKRKHDKVPTRKRRSSDIGEDERESFEKTTCSKSEEKPQINVGVDSSMTNNGSTFKDNS